MISIDENEIARLDLAQFIDHKEACFTQLQALEKVDLILVCNSVKVPLPDLEALQKLIHSKEGVLVLLDPELMQDLEGETWNIVPTLQEAFDFISFERMQRDLGF